MPFKSTKAIRLCKYCETPSKKNLTSGRNKGYYRTCGSIECLKKSYSDPIVNKKRLQFNRINNCKHCTKEYISTSPRQKWCLICVPNTRFQAIMRRYNISAPEFYGMLESIDGTCPICLKRKATMIDHDHKTNKVRGIICSHCNTALNLVEDTESLKRAVDYINRK